MFGAGKLDAIPLGIIALFLAISIAPIFASSGSSVAPDFHLTSTGYEEGELGEPVQFNLTDYRGEIVLLDFMAVNCGSCRQLTAQTLIPIAEAYPEVVILSIDVWAGQRGESVENVIALQRSEGVGWRHALDTDDVLTKYNVFALPQVALVDAEGKLVWKQSGIASFAQAEAAIKRAETGHSGIELATLGLPALAIVAGVAALFAPCSIALLPAYLGVLTAKSRKPLKTGILVAIGMSLVYIEIAAILLFLNTSTAVLKFIGPTTGFLLIGFAVPMLFGWSWGAIIPSRWKKFTGANPIWFGAAYGAGSFACTGPILVPLLVRGFSRGTIDGIVILASYLLALSVGLVVLAVIGKAGTRLAGSKLSLGARRLQIISGVLFILAGAYLIWFDFTAFGWI